MFQETEAEPAKAEPTEFTVKLTQFDAASKVKLIKEIKNLVQGLNLVQVSYLMSTENTVIAVSSSSSYFFLGNSFSHACWNQKTLRLHIFSWFLVSISVEIQK